MMNLNTITAVAFSVMIGSGLGLNTESNTTNSKPVEINAESKTNAQLIDDFSTEIYSWWTGGEGKYVLKRTDDEDLEVKITDAGNPAGQGNGYHCFGRQFDAVDFSKNPVLKLKMKAQGGAPKVRIDLKDIEGMVTNASSVVKTVPAGGDYVEYYYDFTGKWNQSWPDKSVVDPVEIVEMLIFVNPGGPSFTGTLYIDDVSAVTVAEKK